MRAKIAQALAAALAGWLVAGCGALVPGSGGLTSRPTDNGVIGDFIPATMAQVSSGATFQQTLTTLEKELFESCIRRLGFDSKAQAFAFAELNLMPFSVASAYQRAQEASLGLVNIQSLTRNGMLAPIYISFGPHLLSGMSFAELRAIQSDRWRCWSQAQQPARQLNLLGSALFRQWYNVQARVLASAQVQAVNKVFSTCVLREGAPRTAAGSLRQFIGWLEGIINRGAYVIGRSGGGQTFISNSTAALGKTDAQWTAVFARCAGPVVAVLQGLWLVKQQAFVQSHFQQVSELEAIAARTIATLVRTSQQQ